MNRCYDDGALRASVDGALGRPELDELRAHLRVCPSCAARLLELRAAAERTGALLSAPQPDTRAAFARTLTALDRARGADTEQPIRRSSTMTISRGWTRRITLLAAALVAVALLALPPVQAAADQLLKIFRVQSVVFVPVDRDRLRELEQLDFDASTLFVAEPTTVVDPGEPVTVATADEAAAMVGFPVIQPPLAGQDTSTTYAVRGRSVQEFQVNVEAARQLLQAAGVTDVTLPDALGSGPIRADIPPMVVTSVSGADYRLDLIQGRSPEVTVPDGVELEQLGTALLRLLGTSPEKAAALSAQIDWSTTFVLPFPAGMSGVQTVQFGDITALQVSSRRSDGRALQLYWQRGDRFYVLSTQGNVDDATVSALVDATR